MATTIEKTGKTIEDALRAALEELGVSESDVEYEVLEKPSKRLLGLLGTSPAKIRVTLKERPTVIESVVVETAVIEPPVETVSTVEKVPEPPVEEAIETTVEPTSEVTAVEEAASESEPVIDKETIERAIEFLTTVLDKMKLKVEISGREAEEGYVLDISGGNLGILIGKRGQTLDALQYLVNLAANRQQNRRMHFVIDIAGYREKRTESLKKLARSLADRAIKTRKEVRLEPMSRYERKVVHLTLQNNARVETHSAGTDPYRYVIITPVKGGR